MRPVITSIDRGSAYQADPDTPEPHFGEPAPAPVFVSQSGLRGRLLRGFGWPVSVVGAILAVAMGSSLIGGQADAPAMGIPAQPAGSPAPPPSPVPSLSPARPSGPSSSSPPRTATRSAAPQAKTSAGTSKPTADASKPAAAASKPATTTSKPTTTAPRGATPSGRPAKRS
ncbi:hypothetical protein [Streptomyces sp. NRRL F-2580]|uniref:hypothetical protein n=1 Tax=Streptomyces sp. NRRL F-2580 TaxID=1463841 RepID=UPI00131E707D|nr:hypothetical protein [Streptomyces sp. NRRL F-2580]